MANLQSLLFLKHTYKMQNTRAMEPAFYPKSNPMAHSHGHICQCLPRILTLRRNSPLMISSGRRKTGEEFIGAVLDLASGLSGSGVRPGDVVAIAAFNSDLYVEWLLAITYVGGIVAPLNYRWSFEEARAAIELVSPVMLVVDEFCSSWALQLQKNNYIPSLRLHAVIGDSTSQSLSGIASVLTMNDTKRSLQGSLTADLFWAPKGIALICFTSGTTGQPKGVAISHTALIVQSLAKIAIVGYAEDDVYLHTAPLCHIGGISSCIAMLMAGGCHVSMPKFDAKSSIQAIEQHHVTSLITVPAMMADLISYARESSKWEGGKTMKKILNGGGCLSFELISSATHLFPYAKIVSAYGMTEASSSLTFMILYDPICAKFQTLLDDTLGASSAQLCLPHGGICVGKPAPHVEIQINSDHAISCSHSIGKILTRGLHVMAGYWQKATGNLLNSDEHGWLDTGDIGWFDDNGALWLIGRGKDRIKSGGENVYPEEVEAVLAQHPGVSNVVVTGIPDIRLSEKVVACVTVREGWDWVDGMSSDQSIDKKEVSGEILQNFCRQRNLTRFKIPKDYMLWKKPFPLTTTGKLRRDEFRKAVMFSMHFPPSML